MADTFPADRETGSDPDSDHCPSHTVNQPMSKDLVGQNPSQVTESHLSQEHKTKKSRQRFAFAGKRFKASSTMYLKRTFEPNFRTLFPNDLQLVGKIFRCPSKRNGNLWEMESCRVRESEQGEDCPPST